MKTVIINTYSDFLTEKKAETFKHLEDGMEIYVAKGPVFFCVTNELALMYEKQDDDYLPYILPSFNDRIVLAIRKD